MIKRIISISNPARISVKLKQLIIEQKDVETIKVPIEDIGVLLLDHPAIVHTQSAITLCCENNVAVVFSNSKHMPTGLLLPLEGHSLHSKIISLQQEQNIALKKRLWQAIVKAKISEQCDALFYLKGKKSSLEELIPTVKSGDPQNVEAQAARKYWKYLFGESFKRSVESDGTNTFLNYGYAIVRSAVSRAIVGAGLHPSIGIHHKNQYNAFCLADDLMEPIRPLVDKTVYKLVQKKENTELTKEIKESLISILAFNCLYKKQVYPLLVGLNYYAASVRNVICKEEKRVDIPLFIRPNACQ